MKVKRVKRADNSQSCRRYFFQRTARDMSLWHCDIVTLNVMTWHSMSAESNRTEEHIGKPDKFPICPAWTPSEPSSPSSPTDYCQWYQALQTTYRRLGIDETEILPRALPKQIKSRHMMSNPLLMLWFFTFKHVLKPTVFSLYFVSMFMLPSGITNK